MKKIFLLLGISLLLAGCLSGLKNGDASKNANFFNFMMRKQIITDFSMPFEGVGTEVYISSTIGVAPDGNAMKLSTLTTDSNGQINTKIAIPTYVKELWIKAEHAGMDNSYVKVPVVNNKISYDYVAAYRSKAIRYTTKRALRTSKRAVTSPSFITMGTWNNLGVPDYLDEKRDTISTSFSALVNEKYLPKAKQVNTAYTAKGVETNLNITSDAAVWVTFFSNDSSSNNSLGFYTYDTAKGPPGGGITDGAIKIVFPNLNTNPKKSEVGLTQGDRVNIGKIDAGKTIAFVLIKDGFDLKSQKMTEGTEKFYTNEQYNPENYDETKNSNAEYPHSVLLNMDTASTDKRFVFGFKDSFYGEKNEENDFNELLFYASTTDPTTGVDTTMKAVETQDMINPVFDSAILLKKYIYTPGSNQYSTLVYKDVWPDLGDYDFNDAVVDYNFTEKIDTQKVNGFEKEGIVKIEGKFIVRVSLAANDNGFAVELPIDSQYIKSVKGYQKTVFGQDGKHEEYFKFNPNVEGLERDDPNPDNVVNKKAVILITDNIKPYINKVITVTIELTQPFTREELGFAPFNPFIMSNGNRGKEVHLPGQQPTKFSNKPYFNTEDDKSRIGTTYTYKDKEGNPWALDVPESFYYTYDGVSIKDAYLKFDEWVESEGKKSTDWYKNLPGYRDNTKIARK